MMKAKICARAGGINRSISLQEGFVWKLPLSEGVEPNCTEHGEKGETFARCNDISAYEIIRAS